MSTCSLKCPALTISADCARLRAICGPTGKKRSGRWRAGPTPRSSQSRSSAAKGLEWPIVMPINMTGAPKSEPGLAHDRRSNRFSIPVLGVAPAGHEANAAWNEQELARERVRLWYVAATRARDLLVLPRHSTKLPDSSWARVVDLDLSLLDAIDPDALGAVRIGSIPGAENMQTQTLFAEEARRIAKAKSTIERGDLEASPPSEPEPVFVDPEAAEEAVEVEIPDVAGGAMPGTVLHKLMEEVPTGEITDGISDLTRRAAELLSQLGITPAADAKSGLVPAARQLITRTACGSGAQRVSRSAVKPSFHLFSCQKEGWCFSGMLIGADQVLTVNVPKPRISIRSRLTKAASISSKIVLTPFFTSLANKCGLCSAMR